MTGRVTTCGGAVYELPELLEWKLRRTGGVPCDSFRVQCLYSAEMAQTLETANRFTAVEDGETVLFGVIDEWSAVCGEQGLVLEIEGRGLAALLLDNETESVTYQCAALSEILRRHVLPCGVACESGEAYLTGEYKVASGASEWKAVEGFARRCGLTPYFSAEGTLHVRPQGEGQTHSLDADAVLRRAVYRSRRYGVISEVTVVNRQKKLRETIRNARFIARGGSCRRVIYTPSRSMNELRYTGNYQIEESERGARELTLTLAGRTAIEPMDYMELRHELLGLSGRWRVHECVRALDGHGETTELTLWEV